MADDNHPSSPPRTLSSRTDCYYSLYPLHPPQRPTELRTAHFPDLQTPALFVSGSRDGFGTIDEMTVALQLIPSRTHLLTIANSGHELLSKKNQDELPQKIADEFKEMFGAA